jgi:amino acid adenylation domain-containing protein/non-ribosomal peptide synthase protein (TIGR01720 family)
MKQENIESIYELSPTQQGLLFHSLYSPDSGMYAGQFSLTFPDLNAQAFERTWARIMERHTTFRSSFFWEEMDKPLQVVSRRVPLPLEQQDWRGLPADEQAARLQIFLAQDRSRGFNLAQAPLMRFTLIRVGENAYQFIWSQHHLLLDGWSVALVLKEVFTLYEAFNQGQELRLPPTRPYADYIVWLQQQDSAGAEEFWRRTLHGITAPTPLVIERPASHITKEAGVYGESGVYGDQRLCLNNEVSDGLRQFARQHKLTLNTLMQGLWALLLSRYSGEADVIFGAVVSGRPPELSGVEEMVGLFINTLPVRVQIDDSAVLVDWLQRLQAEQVEMRSYEFSPLAQVQRWSDMPAGTPLFQTILAFENYPVDSSLRNDNQGPQVSTTTLTEKANYPLVVVVIPKSEIIIKMNYEDSRLDQDTVVRMLGHLETMLEAMIADPYQPLSAIPLLTDKERKQLLIEWNDTRTDYPAHECIHRLFESHVSRAPESIALVFGDKSLTYAQLNKRSNQLAHYLQASGVGPEVPVGVCMERSVEMLVALLGILKAGGAFLPFESSEPGERLLGMLEDAQAPIVLSKRALENLVNYKGKIIDLTTQRDAIAMQSKENPTSAATADNLAYVMYTSGSTGRPKGVSIIHRNVVRLVRNSNYLNFSAEETFLHTAPFSFDASTFEIWACLLNGSRLILLPPDPPSLAELGYAVEHYGVSVLWLTAGLFNLMVDEQVDSMKGVRHLLTGGDVLSPAHAEKFLQEVRGCSLINCYGPTENTSFSTFYSMTEPRQFAGSIPIGRPVANSQVYILDSHLRPVPCGVYGELYLGGDGLARNYVGSPELTAERFTPNPFSEIAGARLYYSGDLGRYQVSGEIEFVGRLDQLMKVRGFRIEASEVENALIAHSAIREAIVVARQNDSGDKHLVAYLVTAAGSEPTSSEMRLHLKASLPEYMIPTVFVLVDALPLTATGKVDRLALPDPDSHSAQSDSSYVAARTDAEQALVEIWQEVLRVAQVGIYDNFFELGGDSILSIQIVARSNRAGLHLSPKHLFLHPNIATLAAVINRDVSVAVAEQGTVSGVVRLTPIQHWFFENETKHPEHFNQSVMLRLAAGTSEEKFKRTLQELLVQHDALRLRFVRTAAGWSSSNAASEQLSLRRVDLGHLNQADARTAAIEEQAEEVQGSLNLSEGPLMRVVYFDCGAKEEGRLLIVIHHLAVDGISWRILLDDLQRGYEQLSRGEPLALGLKSTSFLKWSEELYRHSQEEEMRQEMPYWTEQLWEQGLPIDKEGDAQSVATSHTVTKRLSVEETRTLLQEVPEAYHTQINEVLMTALGRALGGWLGEGDVVIELEGHGREEVVEGVDLSRTVGWFTTIHPMLLQVGEIEGIGEGLKRVKEQMRNIPRHGIGFGLLKYLSEDAAVRAEMRTIPAGEVSFNYLGQFDQVISGSALLSDAEESSGRVQSEEAKLRHLLTVNSLVRGGQLEVRWGYSEVAHNAERIEQVAQQYMEELRGIIVHCQLPEAGGFTPSDFPEANLSQLDLDELLTDLTCVGQGI